MSLSSVPLFAVSSLWIGPLWTVAVGLLVGVAVLMALRGLVRWTAPKVAAIAWTTSKEALSQPLFYVLLAIGASA